MEGLRGSIHLLFLIVVGSQIIISKCDYCNLSYVPACLNKPHVLCNPKYSDVKSHEIIKNILEPLNELRSNLARNQSICNLHDLTWNTEFEKIANQLLHKPKDSRTGLCTMTNYSNNIVAIDQTINLYNDSSSMVRFFFKFVSNSLTTQSDYKWAASAYSTNIGCSIIIQPSGIGPIICITNGIKIINYEQSYEYKKDSKIDQDKFQNKTCNKINSTCYDHFICRMHDDFVNLQPLSIEFLTIRYILYNFEQKQQNVTWNYDLQYFAERIVAQNLTDFDKCIAREQYKKIKALHFKGVQSFSEQISNIDNIWQNVDVESQIGCTMFNSTINGVVYIHLYCLRSEEAACKNITTCSKIDDKTDIIQNITISREIDNTTFDIQMIIPWLHYAIPILILIDICEIVILLYLKNYILTMLLVIVKTANESDTVYEGIVYRKII